MEITLLAWVLFGLLLYYASHVYIYYWRTSPEEKPKELVNRLADAIAFTINLRLLINFVDVLKVSPLYFWGLAVVVGITICAATQLLVGKISAILTA